MGWTRSRQDDKPCQVSALSTQEIQRQGLHSRVKPLSCVRPAYSDDHLDFHLDRGQHSFCFNFLLCIGIQPINIAVRVSGEQQRDSAIYIHVSILPQIPLPSRLPHNTEQSSLGEGIVKEFGMGRYTLLYLKRTYCKTQATLLNIKWQPGWEGNLGETGSMYMHD